MKENITSMQYELARLKSIQMCMMTFGSILEKRHLFILDTITYNLISI